MFFEALACTVVLFLAHDFFINDKMIEPAMVKGKSWSYPAGFVYYFAFLYATLLIFKIFKTRKVEFF